MKNFVLFRKIIITFVAVASITLFFPSSLYAETNQINNKCKVYITIDDGPGKFTDKYLALFDKYNIKVTYFVTYDNEERRENIKKIHEKGHTIGLHSYEHKPEIIYKDEISYIEDLLKISNVVKNSIGITTKYVRFPFGSSNTISKFNPGIMSRLVAILNMYGYKYFDWNVYGDDAKSADENPDDIYKKSIRQLKGAGNSAVVLCHDSTMNTYKYLEKFIPYLIENGYTILPIDDSTASCHHNISN